MGFMVRSTSMYFSGALENKVEVRLEVEKNHVFRMGLAKNLNQQLREIHHLINQCSRWFFILFMEYWIAHWILKLGPLRGSLVHHLGLLVFANSHIVCLQMQPTPKKMDSITMSSGCVPKMEGYLFVWVCSLLTNS